MSMLILCPECDAKIRAPASALGRTVRCPKCGASFLAAADAGPTPEAEPEPPPPPAPEPEPDPFPVSQPAIRGAAPPFHHPEPPPPQQGHWEGAMESAPSRGYQTPSNPLADFLLFRTMISPVLIQIMFWVGAIACLLIGGFQIVTAIGILIEGSRMGGIYALVLGFYGLAVMLMGPLVVRIQCELLILMFRMYDTLRDIHVAAEKIRRQG